MYTCPAVVLQGTLLGKQNVTFVGLIQVSSYARQYPYFACQGVTQAVTETGKTKWAMSLLLVIWNLF